MQHMWPAQLRHNERDGFQTSDRDGGHPEVTAVNLVVSIPDLSARIDPRSRNQAGSRRSSAVSFAGPVAIVWQGGGMLTCNTRLIMGGHGGGVLWERARGSRISSPLCTHEV